MAKSDETSIWKKEITFRRKPKPQAETPPAVVEAEARPVQAASLPPVVPVTSPLHHEDPPASFAPPPLDLTPAPAPPAPAPAPPVSSPVPVPAPVSVDTRPEPAAAPEPEPAPAPLPVAPEPQPPALSRQERKEAKQAAAALAKKQQQRAKELKKEERKSSRHKHKRVVGLKIGASQLAAAHVVNNGGPRLLQVARAPLPHGVVVGGELREPEQLAVALKTLFRKNKLPQTCVRLGIANNRIGVRTFEIVGVEDDAQLANAVRFRAQEALPIPLDEAVLDYRILDDRVGDDGVRVCRVLLVVAHRELVERYVAACRKAGLKLIGIDLEAFALLRAVADPVSPPPDDAALVCIAIGHDRSTLAVSDGRVCEFARVLAWGGSALDVALARTLDLTPGAAEPVKRELVLGQGGEAAGLDAPDADAARAALVNELRSFARELVGSLRFYQEQPGSLGISEILITGGSSAAAGLATELERLIGIPVRVADPLARVRVQRKARGEHDSVGSLAVAVGLGIED